MDQRAPADEPGPEGEAERAQAHPPDHRRRGTGVHRPPTINDVARLAGVSRQTVSNSVNNPKRVSSQTRSRVQSAIEDLGYRPNRLARSFQAQATRLVGYQVPMEGAGAGWTQFVHHSFLHELTRAGTEHEQHILLLRAEDPDEAAALHEDLYRTRTVDGFVLSETRHGDPRARRLCDLDVPFVTFGRTGMEDQHDCVDVDNAEGTRQAVRHLADQGHERIAYVGLLPGEPVADERARGWHEGIHEAGLPLIEGHDVRGSHHRALGATALDQLLDHPDAPTAIVCVLDEVAAAVQDRARAHGLRVGEDLAVVGFDDTPIAAFLDPPLTTLRQPIRAAAQRCVTRLNDRIGGDASQPRTVLLPPQLIARDSA